MLYRPEITGTDAEQRLCRMAPGNTPAANPAATPPGAPKEAPKTNERLPKDERDLDAIMRAIDEEYKKQNERFQHTIEDQKNGTAGKVESMLSGIDPKHVAAVKELLEKQAKGVKEGALKDILVQQKFERYVRNLDQYRNAADNGWNVIENGIADDKGEPCLYRRVTIDGKPMLARYAQSEEDHMHVIDLTTGEVFRKGKSWGDVGLPKDVFEQQFAADGTLKDYSARVGAKLDTAEKKNAMKKQLEGNRALEEFLNKKDLKLTHFSSNAPFWEQNKDMRDRFEVYDMHSTHTLMKSLMDAFRNRGMTPNLSRLDLQNPMWNFDMMTGMPYMPVQNSLLLPPAMRNAMGMQFDARMNAYRRWPIEQKVPYWKQMAALVKGNNELFAMYQKHVPLYLQGMRDEMAMKTVHVETVELLLQNGWPQQLIDLITPAVDNQGDEAVEWFKVLFDGKLPEAIVSAGPGNAEQPGAPGKKPGEKKEDKETKDRYTLDTLPADKWVEGTKVDGITKKEEQALKYRKILGEPCRTNGEKLEVQVAGTWEDIAGVLKIKNELDADRLRKTLIKGSVGEWVKGIESNNRYDYRLTEQKVFESKGMSELFNLEGHWTYDTKNQKWETRLNVPLDNDPSKTETLTVDGQWIEKGKDGWQYMAGADNRIYRKKGDEVRVLKIDGNTITWEDPAKEAGIVKNEHETVASIYRLLVRDRKIGDWISNKAGYEYKIHIADHALYGRRENESVARKFTGEAANEGWSTATFSV